MIYRFPIFQIHYETHIGKVTTLFNDGTCCPVEVNKDHIYHAKILGIRAGSANLMHEAGHHLVGMIHGNKTCPIVWATAHQQPMPDNSERLEWQITAITYFALRKPMRHEHEWEAIRELANICDVWELADRLKTFCN